MRKLLLPLLIAGAFGGVAQAQMTTNCAPALVRPDMMPLGRGVNLGNMLEAPREGDWGQKLQSDYFPTIRKAGFTLIRLPIRWAAHVSPGPGFTIDPAFMSRVDWVVTQSKHNNLNLILDYHNDDALMKDPDANADRFVAIWKQISKHYQNEPPTILFELLNEPNNKLDGPHWNSLLARTLTVVRKSNPIRTVVVGPVFWNNIQALPQLILPYGDRHLLVTIHFYDPMPFTHQGAEWIEGSKKWLGTKWLETEAEKLSITQAFDSAAAWAVANQSPIFLGEFGSFNRGDIDSRARWTAFVARTAESHHFSWAYWEFCSTFGVYDPATHVWRQPLLDALRPQ